MNANNQFCTFYVDNMLFGVEAARVQEVVTNQKSTRIPLAPSVVEGLMNHRGQVVLALDLRRRLKLADRPKESPAMVVSVFSGNRIVNLMVDQIGDVVRTTEDQFEDVPRTLQGVGRELVCGAFKLREKLLLVLDLDKTVTIDADTTRRQPVAVE